MTSLPITITTVRSEFSKDGKYGNYAKKIFEFGPSGGALEFHD